MSALPCRTLLVDNGSLEPAATLQLRKLASRLAELIGEPVAPVSLLHSSGVPAEALDGIPARILEPTLREWSTERQILLVPLFFGPSRALTDYIPSVVRRVAGQRSVRLADPLVSDGDERVSDLLVDHVHACAGMARHVALVDHGSPVRAVTAVRDQLAQQIARRLGTGWTVAAASMERRPEPEYAFNEPLLSSLLERPEWNSREVVVALQFLLPGRHAGPEGDVAQICARAAARHPLLRPRLTPVLSEHPRLPEILADRWRAARQTAPLS